MLTGVKSTKNGRYGIVDEETGKIVIPLIYKSVSVQKYGIVAECDNSMHSDIFSLSAKKISTTYKNVLLLEDNLLLTCLGNLCMIMNYSDGTFLCDTEADAVLFFAGNKENAQPYTPKTNIENILSDSAYEKYGAHLENRIAIKSSENHLWGVYNRSTNSLSTDFCYPAMVQATGDRIMVRKDNNPTMI